MTKKADPEHTTKADNERVPFYDKELIAKFVYLLLAGHLSYTRKCHQKYTHRLLILFGSYLSRRICVHLFLDNLAPFPNPGLQKGALICFFIVSLAIFLLQFLIVMLLSIKLTIRRSSEILWKKTKINNERI